MLIRSINLINFRQYKNETIEFSCDPEKNCTVILGDNTSGKTTLVKAFLWCLYRINNFTDKILLNADVEDNMVPGASKIVKVVIELEHNNYTYQITTKESYFLTNSGTLVIDNKANTSILKINSDGSVPVPSDRVDEEIRSILDPELKEYFFFDGETNSIESISSKRNLTEAVSDILGLKNIEKLKDYYNPGASESVTSKLTSMLIPVDDALTNTNSSSLDSAISEREDKLNTISKNEEEYKRVKAQYDEKEEILNANKDIEKDQNDKKDLDLAISDNKEKKEKLFTSMIEQLNASNGFLKILFGYSFLKNNIKEDLESSSFTSDQSISYISEEAVDQLIARGYCLCGAEIKDKNSAYQHLIEAKEHMEPHDYGKYSRDFCDAEIANLRYSETTLNDISDIAGKLLDTIEKIDADQEKLKAIIKRIAGRVDVGEVQRSLIDLNGQMNQLTSINRYISENDIPKIEEKIRLLRSQISANASKNSENEFIQLCLDYAQTIYDAADKKIKKSKVEIRERLETEVGSIFKDMYHGNRSIKIDDYFRASTIVSNGSSDKALDKSTGLETVKNFAFVAGLMKLVKESIAKDEYSDEENVDETYPLVMDAPFSNTDEKHIYNVCRALPKYCDQIIIVVMEKDFKYASTAIGSKIGKKYSLHKNSETHTSIEEEF